MKKKELSILIAGSLAASFMLNNVSAVKAEEINNPVVSESASKLNENSDEKSTVNLPDSTSSELETKTTTDAVVPADEEEVNSDCVYLKETII